MENGKVVDVEPMSPFCSTQMEHYKVTDPVKYQSWKVKHNCDFNYKGSAGGIEVAGSLRIFGRS